MTKRANENPEDYFRRVRSGSLALSVKAAALGDNTDLERVKLLGAATAERLDRKSEDSHRQQSAARRLLPLSHAEDYVRKALSTVTSFTATAGEKRYFIESYLVVCDVGPDQTVHRASGVRPKDLVEDLGIALKRQRSA